MDQSCQLCTPTQHHNKLSRVGDTGDEVVAGDEFKSLRKSKFSSYSPELILNLDETQLPGTLSSTYKVIKSSDSKIRLDINKHNVTAMMCCVTASGKKLQLSQVKTDRLLNKFKKYKSVTFELSGIRRQSSAWFNKTHLIKYINDTLLPYTQKQPSLLIIDTVTYPLIIVTM